MNWNLIGHEWAVDLLRIHVAQDNLRHAYLITGPDGVGRRSLAIRLAQAINCTQPPAPGEACGECRACRLFAQMQHPDLEVVQAEQKGGALKVDQVRDLQRRLSLAPYEARYRIAMLLHFEDANLNAANALLKTLEEPASQVILILTADTPESLLPTIASRCECLRLRPLPLDKLAEELVHQKGLALETARELASISNGCPGLALQWLENPAYLEKRKAILNEHVQMLSSRRITRFLFVERVTRERDKAAVLELLATWQSFWHDLLLQSAGIDHPPANLDYQPQIETIKDRLTSSQAHQALRSIDHTVEALDHNANLRLALEVLMLDLPRI